MLTIWLPAASALSAVGQEYTKKVQDLEQKLDNEVRSKVAADAGWKRYQSKALRKEITMHGWKYMVDYDVHITYSIYVHVTHMNMI